MYAVSRRRSIRGLGALGDLVSLDLSTQAARSGVQATNYGNALAQRVAATAGPGRSTTAILSPNDAIAQARTEAEAAAEARRQAQVVAEGAACGASVDAFLAEAARRGLQVPSRDSLMNECFMVGADVFAAQLAQAGIGVRRQTFFQKYKTPIVAAGVGAGALALFALLA
jgi:hypothetical protein